MSKIKFVLPAAIAVGGILVGDGQFGGKGGHRKDEAEVHFLPRGCQGEAEGAEGGRQVLRREEVAGGYKAKK